MSAKSPAILKAVATRADQGARLDLFMTSAFEGMSRKQAKKLIDGRRVSVGGKLEHMANRSLKAGEEVAVRLPPEEKSQKTPEPHVLYRDEHLLAVYKPPGLVSGPTRDKNRAHALKRTEKLTGERLTLLHRLDRDTSGILLFGRTKEASKTLLAAFKKREIEKVYLAVAAGRAPGSFEDVKHLKEVPGSKVVAVRSGGMKALTRFETVAFAGGWSLVIARPHTGRMHQIRIQLSLKGHPIAGDPLYGGAAEITHKGGRLVVARQLLHAWKIAFDHPATGERLELQSPPPADMSEAITLLFGEPEEVLRGRG